MRLKILLLTAMAFAAALPACAKMHKTAHSVAGGITRLEMDIGGRTQAITEGGGRPGNSYQWPGIYFESRFQGDEVTLAFDDPSNNFNLIIDGRAVALLKKPGKVAVTYSQLGTGEHDIRLEKRSETQYATGAFLGFSIPANERALPPVRPVRQIEFIGDSYTVGYGNTSAFTQCTPDEIFETTDAQEGFPALVGKHYNADYQINAFSGLGMVRNYDGREHPKYRMPMLYPRAIFDDSTPTAQPDWRPQIIVVGIGGNDFSTDLHDDEPWKTRDALVADYETTFVKFVQGIRAKNPGAFILIDAPPAERAEYHDAITAVFTTLKTRDHNIDELTLPETDNTGCNGHPNIHDDAKVAGVLEAYFDAHPQVWQGK